MQSGMAQLLCHLELLRAHDVAKHVLEGVRLLRVLRE